MSIMTPHALDVDNGDFVGGAWRVNQSSYVGR